jgi:hypothetical protein
VVALASSPHERTPREWLRGALLAVCPASNQDEPTSLARLQVWATTGS